MVAVTSTSNFPARSGVPESAARVRVQLEATRSLIKFGEENLIELVTRPDPQSTPIDKIEIRYYQGCLPVIVRLAARQA
jgi:hypothetical protein